MAIRIKQGMAKDLTFFVQSSGSTPVDVSTATITFKVLNKNKSVILITKTDTEFDKTSGANGYLVVNINTSESNKTPETYIGELKVQFTTSNIDKSTDISFIVERGIT